MTNKLVVSLEELQAYEAFRYKVNTVPLDLIEWTRAGEPVYSSPEEIDGWKFVGMSNIEFGKELLR